MRIAVSLRNTSKQLLVTVVQTIMSSPRLARALQAARSVIGVNLFASEIDFARRHPSAEFVCQDVVSYLTERPPESIDLVFALNILEHLDKNALVSLLDAARQSLRPGRVVAIVPNATSPFGSMTRYWDFTHQIALRSPRVWLGNLCI